MLDIMYELELREIMKETNPEFGEADLKHAMDLTPTLSLAETNRLALSHQDYTPTDIDPEQLKKEDYTLFNALVQLELDRYAADTPLLKAAYYLRQLFFHYPSCFSVNYGYEDEEYRVAIRTIEWMMHEYSKSDMLSLTTIINRIPKKKPSSNLEYKSYLLVVQSPENKIKIHFSMHEIFIEDFIADIKNKNTIISDGTNYCLHDDAFVLGHQHTRPIISKTKALKELKRIVAGKKIRK